MINKLKVLVWLLLSVFKMLPKANLIVTSFLDIPAR